MDVTRIESVVAAFESIIEQWGVATIRTKPIEPESFDL
jgi:hypothetical protein